MAERLVAKFGKKFKTNDGEPIVLYRHEDGSSVHVGYVIEGESEYFGCYDCVQKDGGFTVEEFAQRLLELAPKCAAPEQPVDESEALLVAAEAYIKYLDDPNDFDGESQDKALRKAIRAAKRARRA